MANIAEQCGCGNLYGLGRLLAYKKSELVGCLLRHFELSQTAAEPMEAQQPARKLLLEAMRFPAIDPDSAEDGEANENEPDEGWHEDEEGGRCGSGRCVGQALAQNLDPFYRKSARGMFAVNAI